MGDMKIEKGFTLAELLIALLVTSIVLSAVATLAHSLGKANEVMREMGSKQTQLRYTSVKLSELIKHCSLVCARDTDTIAVWRNDDNNDSQINKNELVFIETSPDRDFLRLREYSDTSVVALSGVMGITGSTPSYTTLIAECRNVTFHLDSEPPDTRFVSISFEVFEGNAFHKYQISAGLRNGMENLVNQTGSGLIGDDD